MDLAASLRPSILFPTAAFIDPSINPFSFEEQKRSKLDDEPIFSQSNKNNAHLPNTSLWRIDGSGGQGTQFYTVPLFQLPKITPRRIDTFIPDQTLHSPELRKRARSSAAFHTKTSKVAELEIARHVQQSLDCWIKANEGLKEAFNTFPF